MIRPIWERTTVSAIRQLDDPSGHTHIVSMLDPEWPEPDQFDAWPMEHRIILRFHDEIVPRNERLMPEDQMVSALLAFGQGMEAHTAKEARLFIHCQSGMSRSTAGALIIWAQAHPDTGSADLFRALRDIRPIAWPNTLMLKIADRQLNRQDSLAKAAIPFFVERLAEDPDLARRMAKLRRVKDLEDVERLATLKS